MQRHYSDQVHALKSDIVRYLSGTDFASLSDVIDGLYCMGVQPSVTYIKQAMRMLREDGAIVKAREERNKFNTSRPLSTGHKLTSPNVAKKYKDLPGFAASGKNKSDPNPDKGGWKRFKPGDMCIVIKRQWEPFNIPKQSWASMVGVHAHE